MELEQVYAGLLYAYEHADELNIDADKAEKMIESIVYSLTEIKDINGVMIFVEGKRLLKLPNSTTILPLVLDRDIGINKTYDISSLKNVTKLTTYYVAKSEDIPYYIPVTALITISMIKLK